MFTKMDQRNDLGSGVTTVRGGGGEATEMCGLRTRPLANADPQNFFRIRGLAADRVP